jgi:hypothetical protein
VDVLNTLVNAAVIAALGLLLSLQIRRFERENNRRFEQVDRRFEAIEARLDAMRSDLTTVALAAGVGRAHKRSSRLEIVPFPYQVAVRLGHPLL